MKIAAAWAAGKGKKRGNALPLFFIKKTPLLFTSGGVWV